ncbi:MAG: peptidylprolyl isomerase [Actinomycetota bacterium]
MTSSNRRQRQLARAKFERQQARRAEREDKARVRQRVVAIVVVGALVIAGGAWAIFTLIDRGNEPESTASEIDEVAEELIEEIEAGAAVVDICAEPAPTRPDDLTFDTPPDAATAASGTLTLATNCGDISIDLFADDAPATVASMTFLADEGFFDGTACHRLTTAGIFVLQCGDPAGNGTGGPGDQLPDVHLPAEGEANYPAGTVAMANAGPGTGGSQFFLVYEDTTLPSGYTIWGQVTDGLDIVRAIAEAGVADGGGDGVPAQPIVIETATVGVA